MTMILQNKLPVYSLSSLPTVGRSAALGGPPGCSGSSNFGSALTSRPGPMGLPRKPRAVTVQSGHGGCCGVRPICLLCRIKNQNSCSKSHAPTIARARAHATQASHSFPLPSCPAARRQGTPPTASSPLGPHSSPERPPMFTRRRHSPSRG